MLCRELCLRIGATVAPIFSTVMCPLFLRSQGVVFLQSVSASSKLLGRKPFVVFIFSQYHDDDDDVCSDDDGEVEDDDDHEHVDVHTWPLL